MTPTAQETVLITGASRGIGRALTRSLLPLMRRPGGTIVNVTSLLARHAKASAPVYSASKAGMVLMLDRFLPELVARIMMKA